MSKSRTCAPPPCRSRPISRRATAPRKVLDAIGEAAAKGAQLIVFPETFVPYYPYFSFVLPPVRSAPSTCGSTSTRSPCRARRRRPWPPRRARHGVVVVLGVNERDHGTLYNTQLIFDADGA